MQTDNVATQRTARAELRTTRTTRTADTGATPHPPGPPGPPTRELPHTRPRTRGAVAASTPEPIRSALGGAEQAQPLAAPLVVGAQMTDAGPHRAADPRGALGQRVRAYVEHAALVQAPAQHRRHGDSRTEARMRRDDLAQEIAGRRAVVGVREVEMLLGLPALRTP